ncbi:hypothetical protein F5B19DRAFT_498871 [Rostrohypoxylon terebratum]|nr:hypothetical protein F5B19DRAFT_498871 [Rostrohypoxylon terebratum]
MSRLSPPTPSQIAYALNCRLCKIMDEKNEHPSEVHTSSVPSFHLDEISSIHLDATPQFLQPRASEVERGINELEPWEDAYTPSLKSDSILDQKQNCLTKAKRVSRILEHYMSSAKDEYALGYIESTPWKCEVPKNDRSCYGASWEIKTLVSIRDQEFPYVGCILAADGPLYDEKVMYTEQMALYKMADHGLYDHEAGEYKYAERVILTLLTISGATFYVTHGTLDMQKKALSVGRTKAINFADENDELDRSKVFSALGWLLGEPIGKAA